MQLQEHMDLRSVNPSPGFDHQIMEMMGQGWLIDELVIMYAANMKTSIKSK
jgi:hypothetical protein